MGKHASNEQSLFSGKSWMIIAAVVIVCLGAGVAVFFAWPKEDAATKTTVQVRPVAKDEITALYDKGKFDELLPKLETYIKAHGSDLKMRSLHASVLILSGHSDRAVKEYASLVSSNPGNADLLYQAGVAAAQLGRTNDAIDYLTKASKVEPDVALYKIELARLLTKDGQNDPALTQWQQVLSLTPEGDHYRATIFAEMASIYVTKGQVGAAGEIVQNGLKIDPGNEYLKALSAQIAALQPPAPVAKTTTRSRTRR
jgi:tetratricopeptide (TPR) repeat protein